MTRWADTCGLGRVLGTFTWQLQGVSILHMHMSRQLHVHDDRACSWDLKIGKKL